MEAPEDLRQLPVTRHRVRDPRGADHAGVRRDEEDRGGEDADVDLRRRERRPVQPQVLDDPEHRVVLEPLRRVLAEQRHVVAGRILEDGQGRERDERQREVDGEDGDRDEPDRAGDRPPRLTRLLGQVRDGLDAGVGDHRDGDGEREVRPGRGDAKVDVRSEDVHVEDQHEAGDDEQELGREVDHREEDVQGGRLLDPDDVDPDQDDDDDDAADHVPRIRLQRRPEDREVVRDEERRDGDGDDVVEHLRPGRHERDELVEGVPSEARGAPRLGKEHRSLGVGRRGAREDQPRDDEDDRRQPERDRRRDPECVVDRGADVPVRRREQGRCPEHPFQRVRLAPPWHEPSAGTLTVRGADPPPRPCRRRAAPQANRSRPGGGAGPAGASVKLAQAVCLRCGPRR